MWCLESTQHWDDWLDAVGLILVLNVTVLITDCQQQIDDSDKGLVLM